MRVVGSNNRTRSGTPSPRPFLPRRLLALDTSSLACSVALGHGEEVVERHELRAKEHTQLLVPMVEGVLVEAGIRLAELDAVVLGNGPGSFIGMRIAASVAQGLCYGAGRKLVPVSSLAAVAAEAFRVSAAGRVLVAQDAHKGEVYLARYRRGKDGLPIAEGETVLQRIGAIEELAGQHPDSTACFAAGEGWWHYPELARQNEARLAGFIDVRWPRARFLLDLGRRALLAGEAIDPRELRPAYVRDRVAAVPM